MESLTKTEKHSRKYIDLDGKTIKGQRLARETHIRQGRRSGY